MDSTDELNSDIHYVAKGVAPPCGATNGAGTNVLADVTCKQCVYLVGRA